MKVKKHLTLQEALESSFQWNPLIILILFIITFGYQAPQAFNTGIGYLEKTPALECLNSNGFWEECSKTEACTGISDNDNGMTFSEYRVDWNNPDKPSFNNMMTSNGWECL